MSRVYLDHNATSPLREEVRAHLVEKLGALGGNPSSIHRSGRAARAVLDEARARVAAALAVGEDEILFTSGGTESVNLALLGCARALGPGRGVLTSAAEHSAVLGAVRELESRGLRADRVAVDGQCRVDPADVRRGAASGGLGLVSIMAANNEVGTVQPLVAIGADLAALGAARPLFHTDAVQALGRVRVSLREWQVDLASFSVHKLGGPLGVGLLYRRKGTTLSGLHFGGSQEGGLRPGTENVPAISAAALAVELAVREQPLLEERTRELSLRLWRQISETLPDVELLGPSIDARDRLPNTLDIVIAGVDGRTLVARLDLEGLEASAGSACASGSIEPSHVLLAMGLSAEAARAGLRLSLGRATTPQDIHTAVEIVRRTVAALR